MKILRYRVRFLTPAFLGDAEQKGRWRTPPFKALLRQWWRVVWAADHNFPATTDEMRRQEGLLFGNAWLQNDKGDTDFRKSQVRIRLERWDLGRLNHWQGLETGMVPHPEVSRTGYQVGPHAYLGYGPLDGRGGTKLAKPPAIDSGEEAMLSLSIPGDREQEMTRAVALMHAYGTLGSRSRNGWGSIKITPEGSTPPLPVQDAPSRTLRDALKLDWPHAIGRDEHGLLVWETMNAFDSWREVMRALALLRIAVRTQFAFPNVKPPHETVQDRHWLSYPITTHSKREWDSTSRIPNTLRFKVCCAPDNPDKLIGVVYHMACSPPKDFKPSVEHLAKIWRHVYSVLDELAKPEMERQFIVVQNQRWHERLKPELQGIRLRRVQGGQR